MAAIWYRHWLEVRSPLWRLLVIAALVVVLYPILVQDAATYLEESGLLRHDIRNLEPLVPGVPQSALVPWAIHADMLALWAVVLPVVWSVNGRNLVSPLGPSGPSHASAFFTLSLPISRARLVMTRWVAGCVIAAVLVVSGLLAHIASLLVMGQPVPLTLMMASVMRALVYLSAVCAFFVMLALVFRGFWAYIAGFAIAFAMLFSTGPLIARFIAGAAWSDVAVVLAVTGALCAASVLIARTKEY